MRIALLLIVLGCGGGPHEPMPKEPPRPRIVAHRGASFEAPENTRLNRDLFDPIKGQPSAGYAPRAEGGVLSYNEVWYERGNRLTNDKRTSLIFDTADGRIPLTEAARRMNPDLVGPS